MPRIKVVARRIVAHILTRIARATGVAKPQIKPSGLVGMDFFYFATNGTRVMCGSITSYEKGVGYHLKPTRNPKRYRGRQLYALDRSTGAYARFA